MDIMTPQEIQAWSRSLGTNDAERVSGIKDLLQHANEDRMSSEDRTICWAELLRLEAVLNSSGGDI